MSGPARKKTVSMLFVNSEGDQAHNWTGNVTRENQGAGVQKDVGRWRTQGRRIKKGSLKGTRGKSGKPCKKLTERGTYIKEKVVPKPRRGGGDYMSSVTALMSMAVKERTLPVFLCVGEP